MRRIFILLLLLGTGAIMHAQGLGILLYRSTVPFTHLQQKLIIEAAHGHDPEMLVSISSSLDEIKLRPSIHVQPAELTQSFAAIGIDVIHVSQPLPTERATENIDPQLLPWQRQGPLDGSNVVEPQQAKQQWVQQNPAAYQDLINEGAQ